MLEILDNLGIPTEFGGNGITWPTRTLTPIMEFLSIEETTELVGYNSLFSYF
jgi:hypothetical protein